jgi:hypothetical protein
VGSGLTGEELGWDGEVVELGRAWKFGSAGQPGFPHFFPFLFPIFNFKHSTQIQILILKFHFSKCHN